MPISLGIINIFVKRALKLQSAMKTISIVCAVKWKFITN